MSATVMPLLPADARLGAALAGARAAGSASRLLRRGGGTTLPGDVALAIDPRALAKLGRRLEQGAVCVTGTNGKTTTTAMIATGLRATGRRVLSNFSGANLVTGITAAAAADVDLGGRNGSELAIFEVDELSLPRVAAALRPRAVVVLSLLRDQLDRVGELETSAARIGDALAGLPAGSTVIYNADDPLVAFRCTGLTAATIPFGIDATEHLLAGLPHTADARFCPRCGHRLHFARVVLGHCGDYACPQCGLARPRPAISATGVETRGLDQLDITLDSGARLSVGVGGMYNAYNAVAAAATLRLLGLDDQALARALAAFRPHFGRQESFTVHGRTMRMLLVKNPTGFDEVLRSADELAAARHYLIALNDGVADGRDISWIWDVDLERLARSPHRPRVVVAGRRAEDLAVRLKYAGVAADRVVIAADPATALRRLAELTPTGEEALVLPTYTAMLELRAVLEQERVVAPFWQQRATTPG